MDKNTSTTSAAAVADSANAAANKLINNTAAANTSVKLLIKASNQQFDDQIIESDLLWTVKQLKTQLSLVYPSKPPIADQKLIYSGQLLNDALLLKDVIRSYKDVYTQNHIFHLVCMQKNAPISTAKIQKPKLNTVMTPNGNNSNVNADTMDGLRQRHVADNASHQQAQQQIIQQQFQQQQLPNFAPMNPQLMSQWMAAAQAHAAAVTNQCPPNDARMGNASTNSAATLPFSLPGQFTMQQVTQQAAMYTWIQQAYSQYIDQCLRFTNAATIGDSSNQAPNSSSANPTSIGSALPPMINPFLQQMPGLGATGTAVNPVIPSTSSATTFASATSSVPAAAATPVPAPNAGLEQPEQQERQQQQQQVAAPRFPNIVQEEQENRDWLERFFSVIRFVIFLTILYFNASPLRCLIVVIIAGGIYLYHIGVLRLRHERNNNNINRNNNAAVADQIRQGVQQVQQAQAAQEQQHQPNQNNPPNPAGAINANANDNANANNNNDDNRTADNDATNATSEESTTATTAGNHDDNSSNSVISFVRTFVVTFFTSLLPETPTM